MNDQDEEFELIAAAWAAWLNRPIAERRAIQNKVRDTVEACGVEAGFAMMKALEMPSLPIGIMNPVEVMEIWRKVENEHGRDGSRKPLSRLDH